jgi:hypothetical protein
MNKKLVILFHSLFINIFCTNYCSYGESCLNRCDICGVDNDYSNCNYYNLFCNLNSGIKFYEEYENKYTNYFTSNRELNSICGPSDITLDTKEKKKEILKIDKNNVQNYLINKKLHCHFVFQNDYYKDNDRNVSLIIEYQNEENNHIQSNFMIIIMLYSQASYANIFELNKDNLGKQELIELKYYISFTLFIDVDTNNNLKDSITISLLYENKKTLSPIYILLIILGALIFIILVILAISIIKSKLKKNQRQTPERNNNNNAPDPEEIAKKEKIKRIEQLFETEILPIYYSKELDDKEFNGCTICLQKFRDNVSKICILPCNHIFHYKCLYDWLINNKHWKCPICNLDLTEKVKLVPRSSKQVNIQKLTLKQRVYTPTSNELNSINVNTNE